MTDEAQLDHDQIITELRNEVAEELTKALKHLSAANAKVRELISNHVYDTEWAEGSDTGAAIGLIMSARHSIHGAKAIADEVVNRN